MHRRNHSKASVDMELPPPILFIFCNKRIVSGMMAGAIKG